MYYVSNIIKSNKNKRRNYNESHIFTTHNHLMAKNEPPVYETCEMDYTVKHIITE